MHSGGVTLNDGIYGTQETISKSSVHRLGELVGCTHLELVSEDRSVVGEYWHALNGLVLYTSSPSVRKLPKLLPNAPLTKIPVSSCTVLALDPTPVGLTSTSAGSDPPRPPATYQASPCAHTPWAIMPSAAATTRCLTMLVMRNPRSKIFRHFSSMAKKTPANHPGQGLRGGAATV